MVGVVMCEVRHSLSSDSQLESLQMEGFVARSVSLEVGYTVQEWAKYRIFHLLQTACSHMRPHNLALISLIVI